MSFGFGLRARPAGGPGITADALIERVMPMRDKCAKSQNSD